MQHRSIDELLAPSLQIGCIPILKACIRRGFRLFLLLKLLRKATILFRNIDTIQYFYFFFLFVAEIISNGKIISYRRKKNQMATSQYNSSRDVLCKIFSLQVYFSITSFSGRLQMYSKNHLKKNY